MVALSPLVAENVWLATYFTTRVFEELSFEGLTMNGQ
jgi:hypothetical protein